MAPKRLQPSSSGPMARNLLLNTDQYIPSLGFPKLGRWDKTRSNDFYVVDGSVARTQPVELTVVCEISSDKHFLQPHGNYSSNYMPDPDTVGRKVKLVFTGQRPSADPDFASDYDISLERIIALQQEVAKTLYRNNFVVGDKQLRFNFNLFELIVENVILPGEASSSKCSGPSESREAESDSETVKSERSEEDSDEDEELEAGECDEGGEHRSDIKPKASKKSRGHGSASEAYTVMPSLAEIWNETRKKFRCRIMPVYGADRRLIPYHLFPKYLQAGTTVIVSFSLIHYAFGEDRNTGKYSYDSFTANVFEVSILNLYDVGMSRALSTPRKRGRFVSQSPHSRSTLKMAADNFTPAPSVPSTPVRPRVAKGKQRDSSSSVENPPLLSAYDTGKESNAATQEFPPLYLIDLVNTAKSRLGIPVVDTKFDEELLRRVLPIVNEYHGIPAGGSASSTETPLAAATSATDLHHEQNQSAVSSTETGEILERAGSSIVAEDSEVREQADLDDISSGFVTIERPESSVPAVAEDASSLSNSENRSLTEDVTPPANPSPARTVPDRRESRRKK